MTRPNADLTRERRRLMWLLLARLVAFLPLIALGVLIAFLTKLALIAITVLGVALLMRVILGGLLRASANRVSQLEYEGTSASRWWYDSRRKGVAEGRVAPGPYWDGPYLTRHAAEHAPDLARARAQAWNSEDD